MGMTEPLEKNEIDILNLIREAPRMDLRSISSSLKMPIKNLRRSLSKLLRYGLVKYLDPEKKAIEITQRGKFFLEKGDIRIAIGYPPSSEVPDYVAFRFALNDGILTGDVAHSYEEFLNIIERIDSRSITFHLNRGDFDRWFGEVFRDRKLTTRIARLRARKQSSDKMRNRLVKILGERIKEMTPIDNCVEDDRLARDQP